MSLYVQRFNEALERTHEFKLDAPTTVKFDRNQIYLTDKAQAQFPYFLREAVGELSLLDLVAQCHSIHFRLKPVLEDFFGCPLYYTIGWIEYTTGKNMFKFDNDYIRLLLDKGRQPRLNLHVWLTLPSTEVIDVSIATSFAVLHNEMEHAGDIIARKADELKGMAYHPMLVGDDLLRQAGYIVEW